MRPPIAGIIILEPELETWQRRDLNCTFLVHYAGDTDISEDPVEEFHVMPIQSRDKRVQAVDCHEWNSADPIVVRGRTANPGGDVEVDDNAYRIAGLGGDAIRDVLQTDTLNPVHPQPVVTWAVASAAVWGQGGEHIHTLPKCIPKLFPI